MREMLATSRALEASKLLKLPVALAEVGSAGTEDGKVIWRGP